MINLARFGAFGAVLFVFILIIFECVFGIVAYYLPSFLHLTGVFWWIIAIFIFAILNMIFINID